MRDVQTCENRPRDSRIFVGVGIDSVRQVWQNCVVVPALFVKTAPFAANDLAAGVKTKMAPASAVTGSEGLTTEQGALNG